MRVGNKNYDREFKVKIFKYSNTMACWKFGYKILARGYARKTRNITKIAVERYINKYYN